MAKKILIVDDEKFNTMIILNMLRLSGDNYSFLTAEDGRTACDIAMKELPDLILMDWQMPIMTGIDAVKFLKKQEQTRDIPIIMETALISSENLREALNAGAIDYIRKPIDKYELIARVKSAILLYDSFREIKRQKEQIQKQMDELEKLSLIAKETDNSVLLISPDGEIEWANEGFIRMYEYSLNEYKKVNGRKIFESSETVDTEEVITNLLDTKKSATYQTVCETKSGEFKWVQTRITPIFDGAPTIKKFIAVEADITKLKEAERELREKNESLETMTQYLQEVNSMQERQNQTIIKEKQDIEEEKQIIESKKQDIEKEKKQIENLLLNILPKNVAIQLKSSGAAKPRNYRRATVLFTDFKGFTKSCETLTPEQLVYALHTYFVRFDDIVENHYIEKIKTIGDAYMCVGGLPIRNRSNPIDVVLAGLEIQQFMNNLHKFENTENLPYWELRLGIHTGPVIAGVVGKRKFAYDVWGDTVNIAARMEQAGETGKVNVSGETYKYIKDYFDCSYRGRIEAKNKGKIDMYFINGLKPEYSRDETQVFPNDAFLEILNKL